MKESLHIIDTTLREGEQTPGVYFTLEEKKNIIDLLVKIGVAEIELGTVSTLNDCHHQLLVYCREHHPHLRISLWSRCRKEDIQLAAALMPDVLSLSIPASDIHLIKKLKKTRDWAKKSIADSINFAHQLGLSTAIGFEDATRADLDFLVHLAVIADQNGASRIRIADTVGIASPGKITQYIRALRSAVHCDLAIHSHNDFGMASANAIAAFEAGANWADTTVLGLGERTGCARLEEIAGYLALMVDVPLKVEFLKPLAHLVANIAQLEIDRHRPLLGEAIFTCETGLHLQGLYSSPETYEPFSPDQIGAKRMLLIGSKSGRKSILQKLQSLGISNLSSVSEQQVREVRALSKEKRRTLTDKELLTTLLAAPNN